MKKVLHIIPANLTGGVEIAARSLPARRYGTIVFEKYFLVRSATTANSVFERHGPSGSLNRLRVYWSVLANIQRTAPDLIIASLWRSVLAMLLYKMLRPSQRCIVFLHLAEEAHFVDRVLSRIAKRVATEIWADSLTTLKSRCSDAELGKGRVISFVTQHLPPSSPRKLAPEFIFWGRLHEQKDVERAIYIFSQISRAQKGARFRIIGPDGGTEAKLRSLVKALDLVESVEFLGEMDQVAIRQKASTACFYLQTSKAEGMAMSVVEAMQLGLVPLVTPVGEVGRYCQHSGNAIFVQDDRQAVSDILRLLGDEQYYRKLVFAAEEYWREKPLYRDSVIAACRELLT